MGPFVDFGASMARALAISEVYSDIACDIDIS